MASTNSENQFSYDPERFDETIIPTTDSIRNYELSIMMKNLALENENYSDFLDAAEGKGKYVGPQFSRTWFDNLKNQPVEEIQRDDVEEA
jgi:hypothetical protein